MIEALFDFTGRQSGSEAEVAKLTVNACIRSRVASIKAERVGFESAEAGGLKRFEPAAIAASGTGRLMRARVRCGVYGPLLCATPNGFQAMFWYLRRASAVAGKSRCR